MILIEMYAHVMSDGSQKITYLIVQKSSQHVFVLSFLCVFGRNIV